MSADGGHLTKRVHGGRNDDFDKQRGDRCCDSCPHPEGSDKGPGNDGGCVRIARNQSGLYAFTQFLVFVVWSGEELMKRT